MSEVVQVPFMVREDLVNTLQGVYYSDQVSLH